jgi:hypothetical protein
MITSLPRFSRESFSQLPHVLEVNGNACMLEAKFSGSLKTSMGLFNMTYGGTSEQVISFNSDF